ncbi:unnamed protein product [Haemonchus placei]|uniref:HTH_Tnp_Tc3_2 domain-containing protein n=1 Tax=Haemonchus placei TaxID=6290 RepID=A0A3P7VUC5_HAEPC|nr:unnamed protein product [Haemonchus placei]
MPSTICARLVSVHYDDILLEIERCYKSNSSATSQDVANRLRTRGIVVSTSHIRRLRHRLGFEKTTTKYCHTIRDSNKLARLDFCSEMLAAGMAFSDCVFTDECTVQIDCSTKYCFVKRGDQYSRMRSRAKHPAKVHIWGGISVRGTTQFAILPGSSRIDSELYCRILERCYLPFKSGVYNVFCFISCLRKRGVRNLDDLKVAIAQYWKTLTPEVCTRYIRGIKKRMERVVEQEGRNIIEGR